ncbi:nuclear mRNA export, poly(A)+RNA binding protein [Saitozyma podzolica]|uniref:mRNA export factor MEX67 n=1 Tax=Saitozyma podzolica TaxID=1890683 RepID=A0A427YL53_9TREE|nr:nuclear mRNA export, poly(A)+RNA binding protein [Saitozyma podzolica]
MNHRRAPEGTPDILKATDAADTRQAKADQHAKLSEKLKSAEMKQWILSRVIGPGVVDLSNLNDDPWLKEQGIVPPGHRNAPDNSGAVFWKLLDTVVQKENKQNIYTLSLANNDFHHLRSLNRLPYSLPHLRALDLSNNPVRTFGELDVLLAQGEKKGKATAGIGSLKSLVELKLSGCAFREKTISQPKGDETYQHEILRRFPGLLILDGVNLNRIVFAIPRKPKIQHTDDERKRMSSRPFTFPVDVQPGFIDSDIVRSFVMSFCAKYFPIFDSDRGALLPAYAPTATISVSANTLISRSLQAQEVARSRSSRPNPVPFEPWTNLPSRNFFRGANSVETRMKTLKSPTDQAELLRWWRAVPQTKHPLEDPGKWCIDAWVLDGEGVETKLCAMIQGEFQEMPSGTYRSFSRTFILADAPQGSAANAAGWPAVVLSDTMIVTSYLSSGAYDNRRSIAAYGVTIVPPTPVSPGANATVGAPPNQDMLVEQMRQRTGMNVQFATMCLAQNGWDFEVALKNFEEIKATIPAEAYQ